jgi:hypothetical protein
MALLSVRRRGGFADLGSSRSSGLQPEVRGDRFGRRPMVGCHEDARGEPGARASREDDPAGAAFRAFEMNLQAGMRPGFDSAPGAEVGPIADEHHARRRNEEPSAQTSHLDDHGLVQDDWL